MPSTQRSKYSPRWFYSKGAFLVMVWNVLIIISTASLVLLYTYLFLSHQVVIGHSWYWIALLPVCTYLISAPLSGFLADVRFRNYTLYKAGCVCLFFSSVCCGGYVLVVVNESWGNFDVVFIAVASMLMLMGVATCQVTSLQMGMDQMPEASSSHITSLIAWNVFTVFGGAWFVENVFFSLKYCVSDENIRLTVLQVLGLIPSLSMSIVLILDIFVLPKWLIIEPKSPQSLKTIYQVLKFAAKHKAPVNRSAFTYWEEDIPSRLDLGKSRYGGPFSTEQVEDVKTFLKLLVVTLPLWTVCASISQALPIYKLAPVIDIVPSSCLNAVIYWFTYSAWWCVVVGTLVYEFVIYPFIGHRLPTILQRIGIVFFCLVIANAVFLLYVVLVFKNIAVYNSIFIDVHLIVTYLAGSALFTCSLELVYAQAPYNMRGMFSGYVVFMFVISVCASIALNFASEAICSEQCSLVVIFSSRVVLATVGFIVHCVLARWYKRRVRDEDYPAQTVVEEVYDRYLSAHS